MTEILKSSLIFILFSISASTYGQASIEKFDIDSTGKISWTILFKGSGVSYKLQRHQDNKWLDIYEAGANAVIEVDNQEFRDSLFVPLYADINKFKLIISSSTNYSLDLSYKSNSTKNKVPSLKKGDIYLKNNQTYFYIVDQNGKVIKRDSGIIRTSKLEKGKYLICVDKQCFVSFPEREPFKNRNRQAALAARQY